MKQALWIIIMCAVSIFAQTGSQSTNRMFDDSEVKTFELNDIMVEGEIENPGLMELSMLPLQHLPIKELGLEKDKQVFKGAYFISGYSIYDILNDKKVKKTAHNTFSPLIDLYVIVENDLGEKAVFSWGEIYYTGNGSNILISKSVQSINPSKTKTEWPLPDAPQLVCGNDLLNVRFINNPTKITVRSYVGAFAAEKPEDMFSPEINIVAQKKSVIIRDIDSSIDIRKYSSVGYGHGMGFKGVLNITGYLLKDLIATNIKVLPIDLREAVVVISAKDGYRSVFSVSEILNRSDNKDFLLIDQKDSSRDGRYTLFAPDDFFVDRNVKAVEKIEIARVK